MCATCGCGTDEVRIDGVVPDGHEHGTATGTATDTTTTTGTGTGTNTGTDMGTTSCARTPSISSSGCWPATTSSPPTTASGWRSGRW